MDTSITYRIGCATCGRDFAAKRRHAVTCSSRCRLTLHNINKIFNHNKEIDADLFEYTGLDLSKRQSFIKGKLQDHYGNDMEIIRVLGNRLGIARLTLFRITEISLLVLWEDNEENDDIILHYFKY